MGNASVNSIEELNQLYQKIFDDDFVHSQFENLARESATHQASFSHYYATTDDPSAHPSTPSSAFLLETSQNLSDLSTTLSRLLALFIAEQPSSAVEQRIELLQSTHHDPSLSQPPSSPLSPSMSPSISSSSSSSSSPSSHTTTPAPLDPPSLLSSFLSSSPLLASPRLSPFLLSHSPPLDSLSPQPLLSALLSQRPLSPSSLLLALSLLLHLHLHSPTLLLLPSSSLPALLRLLVSYTLIVPDPKLPLPTTTTTSLKPNSSNSSTSSSSSSSSPFSFLSSSPSNSSTSSTSSSSRTSRISLVGSPFRISDSRPNHLLDFSAAFHRPHLPLPPHEHASLLDLSAALAAAPIDGRRFPLAICRKALLVHHLDPTGAASWLATKPLPLMQQLLVEDFLKLQLPEIEKHRAAQQLQEVRREVAAASLAAKILSLPDDPLAELVLDLTALLNDDNEKKNDNDHDNDNDNDECDFVPQYPAHWTRQQFPCCRTCHQVMAPSAFMGGAYAGGWNCDACGKSSASLTDPERWLCVRCASDICFSCIPQPQLSAGAMLANGSGEGRLSSSDTISHSSSDIVQLSSDVSSSDLLSFYDAPPAAYPPPPPPAPSAAPLPIMNSADLASFSLLSVTPPLAATTSISPSIGSPSITPPPTSSSTTSTSSTSTTTIQYQPLSTVFSFGPPPPQSTPSAFPPPSISDVEPPQHQHQQQQQQPALLVDPMLALQIPPAPLLWSSSAEAPEAFSRPVSLLDLLACFAMFLDRLTAELSYISKSQKKAFDLSRATAFNAPDAAALPLLITALSSSLALPDSPVKSLLQLILVKYLRDRLVLEPAPADLALPLRDLLTTLIFDPSLPPSVQPHFHALWLKIDADHCASSSPASSPDLPALDVLSSRANYLKPGMRLEAIDIKNPELVCAATIEDIDGELVRVHFDGWSSFSDYWCPYDHPNLAPIGTSQRLGLQLQPPNKYPGLFSWQPYLRELQAVAAPAAVFLRRDIGPPSETGCMDPQAYKKGLHPRSAAAIAASIESGPPSVQAHPHPLVYTPNHNFSCDNCGGHSEFRYRCLAGCDFDYCDRCLARSPHGRPSADYLAASVQASSNFGALDDLMAQTQSSVGVTSLYSFFLLVSDFTQLYSTLDDWHSVFVAYSDSSNPIHALLVNAMVSQLSTQNLLLSGFKPSAFHFPSLQKLLSFLIDRVALSVHQTPKSSSSSSAFSSSLSSFSSSSAPASTVYDRCLQSLHFYTLFQINLTEPSRSFIQWYIPLVLHETIALFRDALLLLAPDATPSEALRLSVADHLRNTSFFKMTTALLFFLLAGPRPSDSTAVALLPFLTSWYRVLHDLQPCLFLENIPRWFSLSRIFAAASCGRFASSVLSVEPSAAKHNYSTYLSECPFLHAGLGLKLLAKQPDCCLFQPVPPQPTFPLPGSEFDASPSANGVLSDHPFQMVVDQDKSSFLTELLYGTGSSALLYALLSHRAPLPNAMFDESFGHAELANRLSRSAFTTVLYHLGVVTQTAEFSTVLHEYYEHMAQQPYSDLNNVDEKSDLCLKPLSVFLPSWLLDAWYRVTELPAKLSSNIVIDEDRSHGEESDSSNPGVLESALNAALRRMRLLLLLEPSAETLTQLNITLVKPSNKFSPQINVDSSNALTCSEDNLDQQQEDGSRVFRASPVPVVPPVVLAPVTEPLEFSRPVSPSAPDDHVIFDIAPMKIFETVCSQVTCFAEATHLAPESLLNHLHAETFQVKRMLNALSVFSSLLETSHSDEETVAFLKYYTPTFRTSPPPNIMGASLFRSFKHSFETFAQTLLDALTSSQPASTLRLVLLETLAVEPLPGFSAYLLKSTSALSALRQIIHHYLAESSTVSPWSIHLNEALWHVPPQSVPSGNADARKLSYATILLIRILFTQAATSLSSQSELPENYKLDPELLCLSAFQQLLDLYLHPSSSSADLRSTPSSPSSQERLNCQQLIASEISFRSSRLGITIPNVLTKLTARYPDADASRFSISMWISLSQLSRENSTGFRTLFVYGLPSRNNNDLLVHPAILLSPNRSLQIWCSTNSASQPLEKIMCPVVLNFHRWHHLVYVQAGRQVSLYIDGISVVNHRLSADPSFFARSQKKSADSSAAPVPGLALPWPPSHSSHSPFPLSAQPLGGEKKTLSSPAPSTPSSARPPPIALYIGKPRTSILTNNHGFDGILGDMRMFSMPLSNEQVRELWLGGRQSLLPDELSAQMLSFFRSIFFSLPALKHHLIVPFHHVELLLRLFQSSDSIRTKRGLLFLLRQLLPQVNSDNFQWYCDTVSHFFQMIGSGMNTRRATNPLCHTYPNSFAGYHADVLSSEMILLLRSLAPSNHPHWATAVSAVYLQYISPDHLLDQVKLFPLSDLPASSDSSSDAALPLSAPSSPVVTRASEEIPSWLAGMRNSGEASSPSRQKKSSRNTAGSEKVIYPRSPLPMTPLHDEEDALSSAYGAALFSGGHTDVFRVYGRVWIPAEVLTSLSNDAPSACKNDRLSFNQLSHGTVSSFCPSWQTVEVQQDDKPWLIGMDVRFGIRPAQLGAGEPEVEIRIPPQLPEFVPELIDHLFSSLATSPSRPVDLQLLILQVSLMKSYATAMCQATPGCSLPVSPPTSLITHLIELASTPIAVETEIAETPLESRFSQLKQRRIDLLSFGEWLDIDFTAPFNPDQTSPDANEADPSSSSSSSATAVNPAATRSADHSAEREAMIAEMVAVCAQPETICRKILETSRWDLNEAISWVFDNGSRIQSLVLQLEAQQQAQAAAQQRAAATPPPPSAGLGNAAQYIVLLTGFTLEWANTALSHTDGDVYAAFAWLTDHALTHDLNRINKQKQSVISVLSKSVPTFGQLHEESFGAKYFQQPTSLYTDPKIRTEGSSATPPISDEDSAFFSMEQNLDDLARVNEHLVTVTIALLHLYSRNILAHMLVHQFDSVASLIPHAKFIRLLRLLAFRGSQPLISLDTAARVLQQFVHLHGESITNALIQECESNCIRAADSAYDEIAWDIRALPTRDFQILFLPNIEFVRWLVVSLSEHPNCSPLIALRIVDALKHALRSANMHLKYIIFQVISSLAYRFPSLSLKALPYQRLRSVFSARFSKERKSFPCFSPYFQAFAELMSQLTPFEYPREDDPFGIASPPGSPNMFALEPTAGASGLFSPDSPLHSSSPIISSPSSSPSPYSSSSSASSMVSSTSTLGQSLPLSSVFTIPSLDAGDPLKFADKGNKAVTLSGDRATMTNTKASWTMIPIARSWTTGTHYFEVIHHEGSWGSTFFGYVDPAQYSATRRGSGLVNWRAAVSPSTSEVMFGQHIAPGDRLGMLVDVDRGRCAFYQQSQLWGYVPFGYAPISLPATVSPMLGSKGRGDQLEIVPEHFSIPNPSLPFLLSSLHEIHSLLISLSSPAAAHHPSLLLPCLPPKWILRVVYEEASNWFAQITKTHSARCGVPLHFDITPDACHQFVDTTGQALSYEDVVLLPSGREAKIVGVFGGDLWFEEIPHEKATSEVNQSALEGAWYIHRTLVSSSLTLLRRASKPPQPQAIPFSYEQFLAIMQSHATSQEEVGGLKQEKRGGVDTAEAIPSIDHFIQSVVRQHTPSYNVTPQDFVAALAQQFGDVVPFSLDALWCRVFLLRRLNILLQSALPLFNLNHVNPRSSNLVTLLTNTPHYIFWDIKLLFLDDILQASACPVREPDDDLNLPGSLRLIKLSRRQSLEALEATEQPECIRKSLFGQLVLAFPSRSTEIVALRSQWVQRGHRGQKRSFVVEYLGEGVSDYGGPYREVFGLCMKELHSSLLPFLIPTRNNASKSGVDRHLWTFNPAQRDRVASRHYFVLGQLVGIALRSDIELDLSLPDFVWKRLVASPITFSDIVQIDEAARHILELNDITSPALFDELYLEWKVILSDNSTLSIAPDASFENTTVTLEQRDLFVSRWFDARMNEFSVPLNQFVSGFSSIVPLPPLRVFSYAELRTKICGFSLDIDLFEANTVYDRGFSASSPSVRFFWEVLRELPSETQVAFLQFALARSRLPSSARWPIPFRIQALRPELPSDSFLITVSTCFNTMTLPAYSSKQILREKLLISIQCKTMNLDDRISTNW